MFFYTCLQAFLILPVDTYRICSSVVTPSRDSLYVCPMQWERGGGKCDRPFAVTLICGRESAQRKISRSVRIQLYDSSEHCCSYRCTVPRSIIVHVIFDLHHACIHDLLYRVLYIVFCCSGQILTTARNNRVVKTLLVIVVLMHLSMQPCTYLDSTYWYIVIWRCLHNYFVLCFGSARPPEKPTRANHGSNKKQTNKQSERASERAGKRARQLPYNCCSWLTFPGDLPSNAASEHVHMHSRQGVPSSQISGHWKYPARHTRFNRGCCSSGAKHMRQNQFGMSRGRGEGEGAKGPGSGQILCSINSMNQGQHNCCSIVCRSKHAKRGRSTTEGRRGLSDTINFL